jgi:hypothetical protein
MFALLLLPAERPKRRYITSASFRKVKSLRLVSNESVSGEKRWWLRARTVLTSHPLPAHEQPTSPEPGGWPRFEHELHRRVPHLVLLTQYFDTLKDIGTKAGASTIFLPNTRHASPHQQPHPASPPSAACNSAPVQPGISRQLTIQGSKPIVLLS